MNGIYKIRKQKTVLFPKTVQIEMYGTISDNDENYLKINLLSCFDCRDFDTFSVEGEEFKATILLTLENGEKEVEQILRQLNKLTFISGMVVYVVPMDIDMSDLLTELKEEVSKEFKELYGKEVTTMNTTVHKLHFHKVKGLDLYDYEGDVISLTQQFYRGLQKDRYAIDVTVDFEVE